MAALLTSKGPQLTLGVFDSHKNKKKEKAFYQSKRNEEYRLLLKAEIKKSDEDFDHVLNHDLDLLFNYVNHYFLAEKNYIVCVNPHLFEFTDPRLGESHRRH